MASEPATYCLRDRLGRWSHLARPQVRRRYQLAGSVRQSPWLTARSGTQHDSKPQMSGLCGGSSSRTGHTGAVISVLRAGPVAALVTGALAVGGCSSPPRCPPGASCPASAPEVTFIPAVNGVSFAPRKDGHVPRYRVRPGDYLVMRIAVTVRKHVTITALWFGISTGTWGSGPNGPIGMNPILAHYTLPLSTGSHTFGLRWRIPDRARSAPP